ncbi:uncharacterized protein LOC121368583 [Gigantopelta aegis]|uniref:uncharacterized protein LOC121368583 n=1 Tax=Gigantopelta aegis TaxID=1735272 RepID=UPI001B88A35C|nr:uncharacterized protein LOC121368583 [Gigantopelta aegis]
MYFKMGDNRNEFAWIEVKSSELERFNDLLNKGTSSIYSPTTKPRRLKVLKTTKTRIYWYFTYKQSYKYVDHLQTFANSFNSTYHRTIGMAPNKVTDEKETNIWRKMYWPKEDVKTKKKCFRFKVGDKVRLTHLRNVFSREYDERWTGEIFSIIQTLLRGGIPLYRVKYCNGDEILRTFYQSELQKIDVKEDDFWKVEKILKTRGRGANKEHYVKWLNWPKKFNSWVKASGVICTRGG